MLHITRDNIFIFNIIITFSSFRYLSANQVVGVCTGESYVQALKRGCRSVECKYNRFDKYICNLMIIVDLHDGADGRPVVRHSFTFIKDAYLGEILIQIKEFAFYATPSVIFFSHNLIIFIY
jgi:hypothetical protein